MDSCSRLSLNENGNGISGKSNSRSVVVANDEIDVSFFCVSDGIDGFDTT
jgi:hypothetical protein